METDLMTSGQKTLTMRLIISPSSMYISLSFVRLHSDQRINDDSPSTHFKFNYTILLPVDVHVL